MANDRFINVSSRSTRFENLNVDFKVETKKKVLKVKKSSDGTKIEISKK
jgi:hypothetical protein